MTPLEFAEKYKALDVFMVPLEEEKSKTSGVVMPSGAWKRTKVASYRLGDSTYRQSFFNDVKKHIGKEGITVLVKTIGGVQESKTFLNESDAWQHFRHPFVGKGTPEQVQVAIQLTYRFHKTSAAFQDVDKFTAAGFVGLDCNGFVGNYIQRAWQAADTGWDKAGNYADPGPNSAIASLLRLPRNTVLASLDEITPGTQDTFILALCTENGTVYDHLPVVKDGKAATDYGHIMITNPGTARKEAGQLKIRVVESTGGAGLVDSDYVIVSVAPAKDRKKEGIFKVLRGSKDNAKMNVKIARLGA